MNKIIIMGRLTKDPQLNVTNSGTEVCNFCAAVNRRAKKGEEKLADFFDCTAWGKTGVFVSTYFHKGDGIVLEGRMESHKGKDEKGKFWDVIVEQVDFPAGKSGSNEFKEVQPVDQEDLPF